MSDTVPEKKVRYDGRIKKRKWEERIPKTENETKTEPCSEIDKESRKRKKYALLLSYSGDSYFGMQRNPGMKTIEEDLLSALLKCSYITDEAFKQVQTVQFQRAARTDKGVSAARQVVSLKMPGFPDEEVINPHLPECIRVMSILRVTKGFNSKSHCDARTYTYLLPTFSFAPHDANLTAEMTTSFRASPEIMNKVNDTLKLFIGSKNFHNFTSRKKYLDPSANRYIMLFECGDPFVSKDMEFAIIKVKGQSFMLHQIRKMIGLALAVIRGLTNINTVERSWSQDRLDIPMAPGLGLVLEQVHYDRYNERYQFHDALDWVKVEDKVQEFKEKYIYPNIIKPEFDERQMFNWLETLPRHSYDIREGERVADSQEDNTAETSEKED